MDPTWREELDRRGFAALPGAVPTALVERLGAATDAALAAEVAVFPPGDEQYGRLLFAPAYGGPFIDLLELDAVFGVLEELIGPCVLYTMSTSVLRPGEAGPVAAYHRDLELDRPDGISVAAMVLLDAFDESNGATELVVGSHLDRVEVPLDEEDRPTERLLGAPGDVCVFHPKVRHRSHPNLTDRPRRAVVLSMVKPWMKQRVDVAAFLGPELSSSIGPVARRRLGLEAVAPPDVAAFLERRATRPW